MDKNIDITSYIKSQLECNRHIKNKCLEGIGKGLNEYVDYDIIVNQLSERSLYELKGSISRVRFERNSFTKFVISSREDANKEETDLRSIGYFTYGEFGGEYGYFQHKQKLTQEQKDWLEEYKECCYYHGQPCQGNQDETADESCECILGREYTSLVLFELDEEEEKRYGIWK